MPRWSAEKPAVAIAAGADTYDEGYHKGDVGGLDAVDTDLAPANIKDGVNIFGKEGTLVEGVDVSDADAAMADVRTGKTFYSVAAPRKTGTMITRTLSPTHDSVAAGYYALTTLSAVDDDLAPGNIKSGVTIFGKVGTVAPEEDVLGTQKGPSELFVSDTYARHAQAIASGADWNAATTTPTFAALSIAVGVAITYGIASDALALKVRLIMGGVQVSESGYIGSLHIDWKLETGTRSLSGAQAVICRIHNYHAESQDFHSYGPIADTDPVGAAVVTGSIKI